MKFKCILCQTTLLTGWQPPSKFVLFSVQGESTDVFKIIYFQKCSINHACKRCHIISPY
uniref:Uncharacterized protein n=1 Tax=Rhizophora mucronata TaxID=61149 RepID=A0A2P2NIF0_RHIMU